MKMKMNIKQIIFMNIMISLIFSTFMGAAMLLINVGYVPGFYQMWLKGGITGFFVSLPIAFSIIPPIQKLSMRLFVKKSE